jgi:hypothetical protein
MTGDQALMMEASETSETLVNSYQSTWHYNPEDSDLYTHRLENLKSYVWNAYKREFSEEKSKTYHNCFFATKH